MISRNAGTESGTSGPQKITVRCGRVTSQAKQGKGETMTKQETFTTVVNALRKQGEKSQPTEGHGSLCCQYHMEKDGKVLKCAAGWLIPDDQYDFRFEGDTVRVDPSENELSELLFELGHDLDLVESLQSIHDCNPVECWEGCWRSLAEKHGLKMPAKVGK